MTVAPLNTPPTVLSLWHGHIPLPTPSAPSMAAIALEVAERYDLTVDDLRGRDRDRYLSRARQEAMWHMVQNGKSLTQIGRFLGGRDHTTIIAGAKAHALRMEKSAA